MILKEYQYNAVSKFEYYLKSVYINSQDHDYKEKFKKISDSNKKYNDKLKINAPFVCIEAPTASGKTLEPMRNRRSHA